MQHGANVHTSYQVKSPVLFVIFNRPEETARLFAAIRNARPPRLYVIADGPRANKPNEAELCAQARQVITGIDWDCRVFTLFRDSNLGACDAVSKGITWFFENEEEGIILEDDCLPSESFFRYCDTMLELYRHDTRIRHVCGSNLQDSQTRGNASYYFSRLTNIWGWASWRRVWNDYDSKLSAYNAADAAYHLKNVLNDDSLVEGWMRIFKQVKAGPVDFWDYQYALINLFNNSMATVPNVNLITNIGFNAKGTHTLAPNRFADIPLGELGEIVHPAFFVPDRQADKYVLDYAWSLEPEKPRGLKRLFKKIGS